VARFAIGDVQGCHDELRALLRRLRFSADADELWFVGDLVNRGPKSLAVLRFVRSLGANARVVLGNHDLHLLAVAYGAKRQRDDDTLEQVLEARDREGLLEWLVTRPLAQHDARAGDLLVHAGIVPAWSASRAVQLAREVECALVADPKAFFAGMYGNEPDTWSERLVGMARWRFVVNVLTRLRFCTRSSRIDLRFKGPPDEVRAPLAPWFMHGDRRARGARVVCGHWSTLGYYDGRGVRSLDTGCVWGGALTALRLDDPTATPVGVACRRHQAPGD
jgi:bis(5'-nucleosyl)-tetraphosphatase (symmetrical)